MAPRHQALAHGGLQRLADARQIGRRGRYNGFGTIQVTVPPRRLEIPCRGVVAAVVYVSRGEGDNFIAFFDQCLQFR